MNKQSSKPTSRMPLIVVVIAMTVPTIGTYFYFDLFANSAPIIQKTSYVITKIAQFGVLIYSFRWLREQQLKLKSQIESSPIPTKLNWIGIGVQSGMAIGASIVVVYLWILQPLGVMNLAKLTAQEKLRNFGTDSPLVLIAIALFYSVLHSGFEELYWRGLVFRGLREYISLGTAMTLSSFAFMSHHVIVLAKFFGYGSVFTYLLSLGVAVGGVIWAVLYHRSGRLVPGWISHAIVDASIFVVGYMLLFM